MSSPSKAVVTTHILDQTSGKPAAGVRVHLYSNTSTNPDQSGLHVAARTDHDGRIGLWTEVISPGTTAHLSKTDANITIAQQIALQSGPEQWRLVFETGEHFKGKTFWPLVELVILIDPKDERGHWHVPLLLGPFGYTTYRGS